MGLASARFAWYAANAFTWLIGVAFVSFAKGIYMPTAETQSLVAILQFLIVVAGGGWWLANQFSHLKTKMTEAELSRVRDIGELKLMLAQQEAKHLEEFQSLLRADKAVEDRLTTLERKVA